MSNNQAIEVAQQTETSYNALRHQVDDVSVQNDGSTLGVPSERAISEPSSGAGSDESDGESLRSNGSITQIDISERILDDCRGDQDISNGGTEGLNVITVDDAISAYGFGKYQWKLIFMCGSMWSSDALELMLLTFLMPVIKKEWGLENGADGLVGAVVFVGMIFGAVFWGKVADKKGRRFGYVWCIVVAAVSALASTFSPNVTVLTGLRFCVGFGLGGAFIAYSLFAEFVPVNVRGRMLVLEQVFWTVGALLGVFLAWATIPTIGWRWFLFFSSIPLFFNAFLFFILPESPRYLVTVGRTEEAKQILDEVARQNGKIPLEGVLAAHTSGTHGSFKDLLAPELRKTSLLLWVIWFIVTFGYYGISFISPRYFSEDDLYRAVLITTFSELPGLLLPGFCVDRIGRRKTLALGFIIFAGGSLFMAVPLSKDIVTLLDTIFIFIARMCISGVFAITYVYTSEVYPTVVRTTGIGVCNGFSRLAGMTTTFIAEDIATTPSVIIYGLSALIAAVCSILLPIETVGKVLKDEVHHEHEHVGLELTQSRPSVRPNSKKQSERYSQLDDSKFIDA